MMVTYLKKFFNDGEDTFEEVFDYGEDIFEKVFGDDEDIRHDDLAIL